MAIRITDIDFRIVMNDWDRADIMYLRSIYDEKLEQLDQGPARRRTVIRGVG